MDTFNSYSADHQRGQTGTGSRHIDAFGSYSTDYGLRQVQALPAGEPSRLTAANLSALALILAGLPVLSLTLEKLA
jgi:hypothetical protein